MTRNERQKVRVERNPSKKGYMRLHTNMGDLNLELHCDLAPRTCENFFVLSEGGYYTDTAFHRNIKNFMIQVRPVCGILGCVPSGFAPPCKVDAEACSCIGQAFATSSSMMRRIMSKAGAAGRECCRICTSGINSSAVQQCPNTGQVGGGILQMR